MGNQNSHVPFAGKLFTALFCDVSSGRPPIVKLSLQRDLSTILHRMDTEGIAFATDVLPSLARAVILSFETSQFVLPLGFKRKRDTSLPVFLQGLMQDIYTTDGKLLDSPDTCSITEVLQICNLCYKLNVVESFHPLPRNGPWKVKCDDAIARFISVETELASQTIDENDKIIRLGRSIIARIFRSFNRLGIRPRHGPGNVATRERGRAKWRFKRLIPQLHQAFPYQHYMYVGGKHLLDTVDGFCNLKFESAGVTKMTLVPKDSRGPRIISLEPLEMQYIQQGIANSMKLCIERSPLTRGFVNFDDQRINGDLAKESSRSRSYATLDMSDASDRISASLVRELFRDVDDLSVSLFAARSVATRLPAGGQVHYHKFAPMGSALCFPVESIVHYVLAVAIISYYGHVTLSQVLQRKLVYVYGDDLIVKTEYAALLLRHFPRYSLKFNEKKCFIHGKFRESCGVDAYDGVDVTTVKWRKPWPSSSMSAEQAASFCALGSLFYQRSYPQAAELVWSTLEKRLGVKLPTMPLWREVPFLTRRSREPYYHLQTRPVYKADTQSFVHQVKCLVPRGIKHDWCAWDRVLQFCLTGTASDNVSTRLTIKDVMVPL